MAPKQDKDSLKAEALQVADYLEPGVTILSSALPLLRLSWLCTLCFRIEVLMRGRW